MKKCKIIKKHSEFYEADGIEYIDVDLEIDGELWTMRPLTKGNFMYIKLQDDLEKYLPNDILRKLDSIIELMIEEVNR